MTRQYLYLCERCAPEGLSVEEYSTRPLAEVCFVCSEAATRWYVHAERVLKALLQERMRRPAEPGADARDAARYRHLRALATGSWIDLEYSNQPLRGDDLDRRIDQDMQQSNRERSMANHCWHQNETQLTTWTPGEARRYTCCFCGAAMSCEGIVTTIPGHGPRVRRQVSVTYKLPEAECPERTGAEP